MRVLIQLIAALLCSLALRPAYAQVDVVPSSPPISRPWPAARTDTVFVGDTLKVQWQKPSTPARSYGIRDLISLVVDPRWQVDAVPRDVRITMEVKATTNPDHGNYVKAADEDSLMVVQLKVGSRPLADAPAALSRDLDDQDVDAFGFLDAHEFQVVLVDVEVDEGSGYQHVGFLPKALRLENVLVYDRVLMLASLANGPGGISSQGIDCGPVNGGADIELLITWDEVDGADGYDLEWSWVDNYSANGGIATSADYDLDRSSTRITTEHTSYRIPLLYDRGWIVYRVRAVGHHPIYPGVKVTTAWNGAPGAGQTQTPADPDHSYLIGNTSRHQPKKNWQVTTSFAEEGKHKEVMTYADGTLRARQTVTRNNTLLAPIIGETIYDVVGRPAMQIMPVPHVKDFCTTGMENWGRIDYVPQFNREVDGSTHDAITFHDLATNGTTCDPTPPVLHPTNGAEFYYSRDHAIAGNTPGALLVPPQPFLPQASGFPYAQTEYTKDNTGRVRSQGGVGNAFKLGGGHTTTTYYGKPAQLQLDRLFGSEAGYAHHYQKVVTEDPNGQVSISYIDMTGKTVATSLACGAPPELLPLPSNSAGTVESTDLFNGVESTSPELEQLTADADGPKLVFTTTLPVPCYGGYSFNYTVEPIQLTDECWQLQDGDLCVTCGYVLDITLEDQCGDPVQGFTPVHELIGTISSSPNGLSFSCTAPATVTTDLPTVFLTPGEYTLTKTLRLDPATRQAYVDALLDPTNNSCFAAEFPTEEDVAGLDLDDCEVTCAECIEALGSVEEFVLAGGTVQLFEDLKAECNDYCEVTSWCSVARDNMLSDMDINGQYAKYTQQADGTITVTDQASVFHTSSVLLNSYLVNNSNDPERDVNLSLPPWKQPWIEVEGVGYREYRDENNDRIKIDLVLQPGGGFLPPVDDPAHVFYYDPEEQLLPYTYPEYLATLESFTTNWRSGYERSLLRFHPEYCYYKNCRIYGEIADEDDPFSSSDGFDQRLTEAHDAQLAQSDPDTDDGFSPFMVYPLVGPVELHLLDQDPFADASVYGSYATTLEQRYHNYRTIGGMNYSMAQVAAVMARCGGNFTNAPPGSWCSSFGDRYVEGSTTVEVAASVRNNEWATLRAFYLSEKYKLQKQRADAYVDDCGCPGLNHCIGEPQTDTWWNRLHSPYFLPFTSGMSPAEYMTQWMTFFFSQPGNMPCQPCFTGSYPFYSGKVRRIMEPDGAPLHAAAASTGAMASSSAVANFQQTGQCPMATAWQMFFQEFITAGHMDGGGTYPLANSPAWQGVLLAQNDFAPPPPTNGSVAVTTNGSQTVLTFNTGAQTPCVATLDAPVLQPNQAAFHWSDVVMVAALQHTENNEFDLIVYTGTSGPAYTLHGTLCAEFQLAPCNFERVCHANDLGLAWQQLLSNIAMCGDVTTPVPLTALSLPGSGGLSVQSQVGMPIRANFPSNPTFQWSYSAADATLTLRGGTSFTAPRFELRGLSTNPANEPLSYYLQNAGYFTNLNSANENFFSVEVYDDQGNFLCTLSGHLWFIDTSGERPMPVGECELPMPTECDEPENVLLNDLLAVIYERLEYYGPTLYPNEVFNLSASPFMTPELTAAICPECVGSPGDPPTIIPYTVETVYNPGGQNSIRFSFGDCLVLHFMEIGYGTNNPEITVYPTGTATIEEGLQSTVSMLLNPSGNTYTGTLRISSCFQFAPCTPCPEVPEPSASALQTTNPETSEPCIEGVLTGSVAMRWGSGTNAELENLGVVKKDESWDTYAHYGSVVDSLNTRLNYGPTHPQRVQKVPFIDFMKKGYYKTLDHYLRYLRNYIPAIDDHTYLAAIDSFVVDKGNGINVESEYERYLKAVANYNQRAQAAGKPLIVNVETESSFAERLLSGKNHVYVAYLAGKTPSNTLPLSIGNYLNWQENTDPCAVLYRDTYLPAHAAYMVAIADSAHPCFGAEQYTPLAAYEEFVLSNLCCSDTGLVVFQDYIRALATDTLPCPGELPHLATCAVEAAPEAKRLFEHGNECQRLYTLWQDAVSAYRHSDYFLSTGYPLINDIKDYPEFEALGLCDCVQDYLIYLQTYLNWEIDTPKPEKVRPLKEYCNPNKFCSDWFDLLKQHVYVLYPASAYGAIGPQLTLPWNSAAAFIHNGYCNCALAYVNYLADYIQWNGLGTPPPPVKEFVEFCDGVESTCCDDLEYLLQLWGLFRESDFNKEYGCNGQELEEDCSKFISLGQCYCVSDYVTYLQVYVDWQVGDPIPPCPISLKDFCGGTDGPPCANAFNDYNAALVPAIAALGQYNEENNTAYAFYTVTDPGLFNSAGLCHCVDAYTAMLRLFTLDPEGYITQRGFTDDLESIVRHCEVPLACCPRPFPPQIIEPPAPVEVDPCAFGLEANLWINLQAAQEAYISTYTQNITDRYNSECLNALETFTMTYPDAEHHFTLYYYDRAGNLVRTVPPEGVERKAFTSYDAPEALRIAADRNNGTHTVFTAHRLASDHAYNSLNQPIRTAMPDQDNMDIRETGATAGLPEALNITGSWFGDGGRGYVSGELLGTTPPRGAAYTTNNGGVTWQRTLGLVAADLFGAHYPTATRGYAVGEHGTVLRSLDAGTTWDLLPNELLAQGERWNDVAFHDVNNGVAVGPFGIARSSNGGDAFTPFDLPDVSNLASIGVNSPGYWACGTGIDASITQGIFVQGAPNGVFGPAITMGSTAADIRCASSYSQNGAYVGGAMGVLLHTADGGQTWSTRVTGMVMDFVAVHFVNEMVGVAIVDSTFDGGNRRVLHRTANGGRTWHPAGRAGVNLNALAPVLHSTGTDYSECMTVGNNGLVWKLVINPDPTEGTVGIVTAPPLAPQSSGSLPDVTAVWAAWDQAATPKALRCIVGLGTGGLQWKAHLPQGPWTADWTNVSPITGLVAAIRPGGQVHGRALRSSGGFRNFKYDFSATPSTFTSANVTTSQWRAMVQLDATSAVARNATANVLEQFVLDYDAGFTTTQPYGTGLALADHTATAAFAGSTNLVLTGGNGALYTANTTPAVTDRRQQIRPVPLNAMDKEGKAAAGRQGTVFLPVSGTHWKAIPTRHVEDLTAVQFLGGPLVAVGAGGTAFRLNSTNPTSVTDIPLPIATDLTAVRAVGTELTIGTTNGTLLHSGDYTAATPVFDVLTYSGGTIRALAAKPTSTVLTAVGDGALVHDVDQGIRTVNNDVYTPPLNAVDFHDGMHGYVVGNDRVARYTGDGGAHWRVVPGPSSTDADDLHHLNGVDVHATNECWMVGDAGTVARVSSGTTWNALNGFPATHDLHTVAHAASGALVLAGANGPNGGVFHRCNASTSPPTFASFQSHNMPKPQYASWAFEPYFNDQNAIEEDILIGGDDQTCTRIRFVDGDMIGEEPVEFESPSADIDIRSFWFHDRLVGLAGGLNGRMYRTKGVLLDHSDLSWAPQPIDLTDAIDGQTFADCDINTIGFTDRFNGFVGGANDGAGPPRYARTLRDEMGLWSQRFWYDRIGRIVLSQNTKQKQADPQRYSYTLYDALGRAYEAGEVDDQQDPLHADAFRNAVPGALVGGNFDPSVLDADQLKAWVVSRPRHEVTRTWYDEPLPGLDAVLTYPQKNLRLRVASTTFQEEYDPDPVVYQHATHYSYDIHGNVASLVQDHPQMDLDAGGVGLGHRFKKMFYRYDLISGNVKEVWYQHRKPDAMYHRYAYDADNRLIKAETSTDRQSWYTDAEYFYYAHGPLARVELGENKVQGIDYAYTLQGWLKGINSDRLVPANDMGQDGLAGGANAGIGRDAFGESIGYYGDEDYAAIDPDRWSNTNGTRPFAPIGTGGSLHDGYHKLYNGNIAHTVNTLSPFPTGSNTEAWTTATSQSQVLAQVYQYDQLHRLREAKGIQGLGSTNTWHNVNDATVDRYKSVYAYDANGNILSADRHDQNGVVYDNLRYKYQGSEPVTTPTPVASQTLRNRLYELYDNDPDHTDDAAEGDIVTLVDPNTTPAATPHLSHATDLNASSNYRYDPLGQLTHDSREGIENIDWTVAGKVNSVTYANTSPRDPLFFTYGAGGHRIQKQVGLAPNTGVGYREHYIRDAQGNIMAIYRYSNVPNAGVSLKVKERPVYGSSRIGSYAHEREMYGLDLLVQPTTYVNIVAPMLASKQQYELTDHLGNITAVVTAQLLPGNGAGSAWQPALLSAQGYEPFGSLLPGRNYSSDRYAHGFNGMRKDDEVHGATGTSYDFGARLYDPRIGRWPSLDPLAAKHPELSPYSFVNGNPIAFIDPDGRDYKYSVSFLKDKNGTIIKKIVHIDVAIKVLNLTSQSVSITDFSIPEARAANIFDYRTTSAIHDDSDAKGYREIETVVDVSFHFAMAKSVNDIKPGENALLVTDEVRNTSLGESAGVARLDGNVAMVDVEHLNNKGWVQLVLHEMAHTMGLDDNYTEANGRIVNPGYGLMGAMSQKSMTGDLTLTDSERKLFGFHTRIVSGTHDTGNVKSNAREFGKEHGSPDNGRSSKLD